jgi:gluconokinase
MMGRSLHAVWYEVHQPENHTILNLRGNPKCSQTTALVRRNAVLVTPPIVVMGVSGSGKSTVGEALAARLNVPYLDADDLHSAANVSKMASGIALTDADREPWLARVGDWLAAQKDGSVVACSALRRSYLDTLRAHAPGTVFLHLDAESAVLQARVSERSGHFMPASLLASQLATLEPLQPDERGTSIDSRAPVNDVVDAFVTLFRPDRYNHLP